MAAAVQNCSHKAAGATKGVGVIVQYDRCRSAATCLSANMRLATCQSLGLTADRTPEDYRFSAHCALRHPGG